MWLSEVVVIRAWVLGPRLLKAVFGLEARSKKKVILSDGLG